MSTEPSQSGNSNGYERRDANIRALINFGIGLAVLVVVVIFLMRWMFGFVSKEEPLGPPPTPFENARTLPPQPRLQVEPHVDLKAYCEEQVKDLNSYGWVDQKAGVVHIPIERAMQLIAQRGLTTTPRVGTEPPAEVQSTAKQ